MAFAYAESVAHSRRTHVPSAYVQRDIKLSRPRFGVYTQLREVPAISKKDTTTR
jgi:hypothetical protein